MVMMETLMIGTGGDDAYVVDALHLRRFPGGRPDLIVGPRASDNRGFEKRQVGGWSHPGAVGQTVLPSDGSRESVFRCVSSSEIKL